MANICKNAQGELAFLEHMHIESVNSENSEEDPAVFSSKACLLPSSL